MRSKFFNSSSVTTDNQGNITNLIDYMPFGTDRINVQNQGFSPSYKFTDQENDLESGLMNFDARYYEQNVGRFPQVDAVAFYMPQITDPQQLNYYSYGRNNPIRYQDPTGNVIIETNDQGKTSMTFETGDTLSQIATMFDMDYQTLADQLGIEDPNKINEGDNYDITAIMGGLGYGIVNLKDSGYLRMEKSDFGGKTRWHGHRFDRFGRDMFQSENMDGTVHDKGKNNSPFDNKLREELKDNKQYQKYQRLQKDWDDTHQDNNNDKDNKSGGVSSSDGSNATGLYNPSPNTMFVLPGVLIIPGPTFNFNFGFLFSPLLVTP